MSSITISRGADFPIGDLARRTGTNIETIRYYERIGILAPVARSASGRRRYGRAEERRLSFVRRARRLGFSLDEIRNLLGLGAKANPCSRVNEIASRHLDDVRAKIADLRRLEAILAAAVARCGESAEVACPVLEMLEGDSEG
jgi:MerR family mercuric resistance operon transcriptional regulator